MYRIRLASGEEAVYKSADELAQAVSSGVVGGDAEVFHKSAGKWLPINLHPDYRAVATGKRPAAPLAILSALPSTPPSTSRGPEPLESAPPIALPSPAATPSPIAIEPPGPQVAPNLLEVARATAEAAPLHRSRAGKLRVMLSLTMGVFALGMVGGGAILAWPKVTAWRQARLERDATLSEGMPPSAAKAVPDSLGLPAASAPEGAATRRLDSLPDLFPAPSKPLATAVPGTDSLAVPTHDETRVSRLTATRTRLPSYFEAYADARAEMDDGFDYVSFRRVFAPSRFAAPESLRAARRMVAAAGNILRVYRGREVMLEQTYRPDDPGGRGSLREPFETAEAARALLADVDSLFGLLVSQQGRFSYGSQAVRFQDPRTARVYNQLRTEIIMALSAWRDSSGATNRVTLPRLLQAFGETLPPPAQ